jgi:membrane protease YdiL (CAAX protease family)
MLKLNQVIFKLIARLDKELSGTIMKYNFHIWFSVILVVGIIGRNTFYILAPKQAIPVSEVVVILLALVPFMVASGYALEKNFKGITRFCILFPIGEEILFRGIILSLATYLVGNSTIYVPVPILKGVTLQVFLSAICFGITHLQYFDFRLDSTTIRKVLFAFLFGLFAGNVVEITGSVFYPVIFHVLANTGATLYFLRYSNKIRAETL